MNGALLLYVGNRSQAKIMVFDRTTLALLDEFGQWGSAPGDFGTLHHMAAEVGPLRLCSESSAQVTCHDERH